MLRFLTSCLCAALFPLSTVAAAADAPLKAMDGYEHAQNMRSEAGKMAQGGSEEDLRKGIQHLQAALDYLAQPQLRELATGNIYLYARGNDIRLDMARLYAKLGDKDKSLTALEGSQKFFWLPHVGTRFAKDEDFAILKDEPRFKTFLSTAAIPEALWKTPAIATPYKERLSVEERVAGLSLFWAEARQNFVFFDHVPDLQWDKVYMEFLGKVMAAESTVDYYRVMMRLAALLEDGHTGVYAPKELRDVFYARPPMRAAKVQDKVLVISVSSPTLAKQIGVGDEIVAIDGIPVQQYATERVKPFVSSSTPQDRETRMYTYQLFSGDAAKPLKLTLRAASGKEREETVARSGYTDVEGNPQADFRMLPNGVAYVALNQFENRAGVDAFEKALPQIMEAKALILDVRRNGGGSTNIGWDILTYLTEGSIPGSNSWQRADIGNQRNGVVRWVPLGDGSDYKRKREKIFKGPVAVLIGPQTFSAAEDFLVSFDEMKRGIMVGEPTGGSTGQPMQISLPGGGGARICIKRDTYLDGREFVGKGITPNLQVKPTTADIRAGRDPVLDAAVATLLKK